MNFELYSSQFSQVKLSRTEAAMQSSLSLMVPSIEQVTPFSVEYHSRERIANRRYDNFVVSIDIIH